MMDRLYRVLLFFGDLFGSRFFAIMAKWIGLGYFIMKPGPRKNGIRFYESLFPANPRFKYYLYTFRQFKNFTDVFTDRLRLQGRPDLSYTMTGWEHLKTALWKRQGAILVMSHMGNWEAAAHLLHRDLPGLRLLLYMGIRQKEAIERLQKEHLSQRGVRIIGVAEDGGSAFDIVEGVRFLKAGGFVSMTGDRMWRKDQRAVSGVFLGRPVRVPEAPFVLALVSGSPILFFFSFRVGPGRYHFTASRPLYLRPGTRSERRDVIHSAVRDYLSALEGSARTYPFQWYHFEDFFEPDCLETVGKV